MGNIKYNKWSTNNHLGNKPNKASVQNKMTK